MPTFHAVEDTIVVLGKDVSAGKEGVVIPGGHM
jgi:hypothetical protein